MKKSIPAISIRQPWAELILRGEKQIEIRKWDTLYRGMLYLHTGKKPVDLKIFGFDMLDVFVGGYIGIIELETVVPFSVDTWVKWSDKHLSHDSYRAGLYAWILRNARRFVHPIPAPGKLGIFWPDSNISNVLERTPIK